MNGTITIERSEILSLVSCAEDYGFENDVLFTSFRGWLKTLPDEEIADYGASFLTTEAMAKGYGQEDADSAVRRLRAFRSRYLPETPT